VLGHEVAGIVAAVGPDVSQVHVGDHARCTRNLYLQGRMNLDDLVSKRIALREVNDGYGALKDGALNRVVGRSF
jgi:Zn-dependent alcohol dehydrogenase